MSVHSDPHYYPGIYYVLPLRACLWGMYEGCVCCHLSWHLINDHSWSCQCGDNNGLINISGRWNGRCYSWDRCPEGWGYVNLPFIFCSLWWMMVGPLLIDLWAGRGTLNSIYNTLLFYGSGEKVPVKNYLLVSALYKLFNYLRWC